MTKLKLFVWTDFARDYTGGLAFAIAKDENEAREMILNANKSDIYSWGNLEVKSISKCAYCVAGGG